MSSNNTVVVTGGAGFVGSHLCKRLLDQGHRVISLDNYFTGSKENHHDGVEYREGHTKDIAEYISETPDILFHLGEYPRVEQSFGDVATVFDFNQLGTQKVLEFWREKKCKLVYAGSSTKFADAGIGREQSPYAWTKAANTELVRLYSEWFNLPYAITYFYNVYGPGERGDNQTGTVIGIFAERVAAGKPLQIIGSGEQRRNFTHVYDIVDGLVAVGEKGQGDEYGLGHSDSYSILEVANMFGGNIEMVPNRPGNRRTSRVDLHRAQLELGWHTKYNLPDYIASLIT